MIISLTHHILLSIQDLEQSEATIPPQLIEYMPDDYFTDSSYLIVYTGYGTQEISHELFHCHQSYCPPVS